jgi:NodT family efflux transporter outer membrane factor (OMF) lipoprotein
MRGRIPDAIAVALLVALPGCAVGPDYHPPTLAEGAQAPLVSVVASVESSSEPPEQWWELYYDPLLERYVQEAFKANADIKVAAANLSAARAVLQGARAGRYPQTAANAGYTYGRDAVTDEILEIGSHEPKNISIYDAIVDMSYEVDLVGRVRRSIESATAEADETAAIRDSVRITVAAETARAYAQVCALGEELEVVQHSLEVVRRQAQITQLRNDAGANSEFDVVRAQGLVAQVSAAIPPLQGQRQAATFQLAALMGRTPTNAPTEVQRCVTPLELRDVMPVGDGATLLRRRPDVRQAERRVAAATARIGVATADLYPRISLTGFLGGVSSELSQLTTNQGVTWGIGPSITWSFPNQSGPRARVRQAKANAVAALANFDGVVLQALKETEQALSAYSTERERRQALSDAQERAHKAFDLARGQIDAGAISNLDLLASEQVLVLTDQAVAASDAALVQDQIAVFKALGGGWRTGP